MKQILKTKFALRWAPFTMAALLLFSATVAQPAQAASTANIVKCNSIAAFATASGSALKISQQGMQTTFQLTLEVMQTTWKLEDQATAALRQVSESAFTSLSTAFAN